MRTIKLIIAYDGTDFCGWQRQIARDPASGSNLPHRTVQAEVENALEKIHHHPVIITGSGRTDSGVHAAGQVAGFRTDIESIKPENFVPALNSLLPQDVRIMEAAEASPGFHARFDARCRTYRYHFICGRQAFPGENRYALQLWHRPQIDLLNAYCRILPGERDCSLFAASEGKSEGDNTVKSPFRYIYRSSFFMENRQLIFEICANAFLWKMVRSIAGTFLHYEQLNTGPEQMQEIISSNDRKLAGPTLPPHGLFLWKIDYYRE